MKRALLAGLAAIAISAGAATAQGANDFEGPYVVAEIGYDNGAFGFDQFIYGGAAGYNFKLTPELYVGVEGEILGSTSDIVDFTWGGHGYVGYILQPGTSVFARAGYREFEFDFGTGGNISGGDYSLGLGAQFGLTEQIGFRTLVDTVGFDTVGVRGGLVFSF